MRAERLRREGQRAWWEADLLLVTLEAEDGTSPFFVAVLALRGPRFEPPSAALLLMVALA
jgi:hypothetical protein